MVKSHTLFEHRHKRLRNRFPQPLPHGQGGTTSRPQAKVRCQFRLPLHILHPLNEGRHEGEGEAGIPPRIPFQLAVTLRIAVGVLLVLGGN